ncbi:MAG: VOC family protein [Ilumatobacter sp.]|nr:VOC family protein [Ilumatobacter sp.]
MSGFSVQVVIDCQDPHVLADWWAETLRWTVEPQDEAFIRSMIDQGFATDADTRRHEGKLVWREGAAINAAEGDGSPRIYFQQVPESKSAKNRLHLDVRTGDEDTAAIRDALVARGATVLHEGRQGPHTWVTLADPEGNEFCV